jgi:hypothetical protein
MNARPGPAGVDEDTCDIIDNALAVLAERRGVSFGDDLAVIGLPATLQAQTERVLPWAVTGARVEGAAWDEIARLLGTSPLETELCFDPDSPVADRRWPFDIP